MNPKRLSGDSLDKPSSLREQISTALRAALITGEMLPGETYSVPAIAEKFGISATPVREAMLDLTKDGILVALPNKGFQVVATSAETLRQLTEIRLLHEIRVTVEIAKAITPKQVARLREVAVAIQEFAQQNDLMNFIEMDRIFHSGILELSGNPMLVQVADQFRSRARIHALPYILESGQLEASALEHIQLLDAMDRRDLETVAKVMEHHINYTIDAVFAMSLVKKAAK